MGFLDALLGRSKPVKPDLDQLFGLPSAALTLESAMGLTPTGEGSVCFKAAEGAAFAEMQAEVQQLLASDGGPAEQQRDSYGFTWLVCRHDPADVSGLVTELHAVNSSLEAAGFGPQLLCSVVGFSGQIGGAARTVGLVYLYKRGSFYPFAPLGAERRDNALELQMRGMLTDDLKVEPDLSRWFPVWGAPGL
ncbi:MAG: PspA-associated protein PspAB [Frankiaceae bacterium]